MFARRASARRVHATRTLLRQRVVNRALGEPSPSVFRMGSDLGPRAGAQFAAHPLPIRAAFTPVGVAAVAQFAGAQAAAVPEPGPVTVATFTPQGVVIAGVGKVAYAVGVVVHFDARDVATGDTDMKRDVGVGTRHGCLRGFRAPARDPSAKDGPGL